MVDYIKIQKVAIDAARNTEGIKRYKLGAVLFDDKGRIIRAKGNSRKTHPILAKYSPFPFLHAESACILSQGLDNCRGLHLFVCRINSLSCTTMAAPCSACIGLCTDVGIRSISYTDWNGKIVENSIRH